MKTLPVIFVYITFVFLYCCNFVASEVLTQYDGLEEDYWKWKESVTPTVGAIGRVFGYFSSFQKNPAPSPEHDESEKKELCDSFVLANNFVYLKGVMESLAKRDKSKQIFSKRSAEFHPDNQVRDIQIGTRKDSMKMFRCHTNNNNNLIFHLAFAHQKGYAYVITTIKDKKESPKTVVFQAILQPSATIDQTFLSHKSKLPLVFWKNVTQEDVGLQKPIQKSLCALTENQHFNTCSIVADKLYRDLNFTDFALDTVNYIHKIPERCVEKNIIDPMGERKTTRNVLPCAINEKDWSKAQFFLLRHTSSTNLKTSVYVLKNADNGLLTLFTRIDDVQALTMPEKEELNR